MEVKTKDPIVTLKKIKVCPEQSEETNCFSANIYVDGKIAGEVKNSGRGGCNDYWWKDRAVGKRVAAWAACQELRFDFEKLDQIIDALLMKWEEMRYLKKACKAQILFRLKGDKKDEWRILKSEQGWCQAAVDYLTNKYGDDLERIANQDVNPL